MGQTELQQTPGKQIIMFMRQNKAFEMLMLIYLPNKTVEDERCFQ